jgi:predicted PurR-regulated permease PerM
MSSRLFVYILQKKWAQFAGITCIIYGLAFSCFLLLKLLMWAIILYCFLSPLYRKHPPYHLISLVFLILISVIGLFFFIKPFQLPALLDPKLFPFSHHCSPSVSGFFTDFRDLQKACIRTTQSAIRHLWPDIYTLVIVFPVTVLFLISQKKIARSFYRMIPNYNFEMTGYIMGTLFYYLPPFILRLVLKAATNSLLWGLALFLIAWPHAFEFAVLMGIASLVPFGGIWFGFLFPLSTLGQEPVHFIRFIEYIIALAVLWLINHLVFTLSMESPTTSSDKYLCFMFLACGFALWGCNGLLGFGVLFSFVMFWHQYLSNGTRLLIYPHVNSP